MAAELLRRYFHTEIQPKLFPGSGWLGRSLNDDAFVNFNTVELPHSGNNPNVSVNRTSFPATPSQRTDVATNYELEELTTDPTHLQHSEALLVSYNKRASILDQHARTINTKGADRILYKWAAGATVKVPTTGSARLAQGPSQTGNRKAVTEKDIIAMQKQFFKDDVVNELGDINGVAILTPAMYADLIELDAFKDADKYGRSNIPSGIVARAYGFDFYVRSRVVVTDDTDALKAEGAAAAATDQDAAIFYSPDFVRRALGSIEVFIEEGKADYYGDLFSMLVRFGGCAARNDGKGVYLLYEDTTT